ncbi:hypothetical protein Cgig2_013652 [Carnegiea gigantea]|uniref:Uncharacterized protein n=1 Tax=Carnegiea gigantea TaxID=171969 RepID=A0A9Q1JVV3_9CARY|nr:hypothetical protein Cgig2_013652 [Carnegiea gigantea]
MKSLLKKIIAALSSKTNEIRIRIMIFFLLHKSSIDKNTSITHSLSHKLHALVAPRHHHHTKKNEDVLQHEEDGGTHLLISYNRAEGTRERYTENFINKEEEEEEGVPRLDSHAFQGVGGSLGRRRGGRSGGGGGGGGRWRSGRGGGGGEGYRPGGGLVHQKITTKKRDVGRNCAQFCPRSVPHMS